MSSAAPTIAVALLSGRGEFGDRVRESMAALGTPVVYEAEPHAFDRAALEDSRANVVVVNLDAASDADFDNVYDLLDDPRYRVVFNDNDVSGSLTGWDQARWLRHLAAKIIGAHDIDPPRPADAQAVRAVVASNASALAATRDWTSSDAAPSVPTATIEAALVHDPVAPPSQPSEWAEAAQTGDALIDLDAVIDTWELAPEAPVAHTQAPGDELDIAELDDLAFDFELPDAAPAADAPIGGESHNAPEIELGALDSDGAFAAPAATLDADLENFDFGEFELELPKETEAPALETSTHAAADHGITFEDAAPSADASISAGVAHEDSAVDAAEPTDAASSARGSASAPAEFAFSSNDWTLEDVLDEAPAAPPELPAFGIEKMAAADFLAPGVDAAPAHPIEVPQGLSLELIPLEEAVAPVQVEAASRENWLDPDSVQPKIRRVWVLGASIGGPEAVREFLAALPRDFPALFVLAQHLGDEFVDMMAKQLAQATALTVRTPIHGARVGHGEVVIVPNGKRMLVDSMGVVVLERETEQAAFSPSIDRVITDIADRFGNNAGAIVFSGMTDDAVEGCRHLAAKGGLIYAQRPDTCVVSTMIDAACEAGVVSFSGSPQELAEKLIAG